MPTRPTEDIVAGIRIDGFHRDSGVLQGGYAPRVGNRHHCIATLHDQERGGLLINMAHG